MLPPMAGTKSELRRKISAGDVGLINGKIGTGIGSTGSLTGTSYTLDNGLIYVPLHGNTTTLMKALITT